MSKRTPNFTQIPNEFLDETKDLTDQEFRVLMVVSRKIYGWHKNCDKISLSQFQEITGMRRPSIVKALRGLQQKGFIEPSKCKNRTTEFTIKYEFSGSHAEPELVHTSNQKSGLSGSHAEHTKESIINKINKGNSLKANTGNNSTSKRLKSESITRKNKTEIESKPISGNTNAESGQFHDVKMSPHKELAGYFYDRMKAKYNPTGGKPKWVKGKYDTAVKKLLELGESDLNYIYRKVDAYFNKMQTDKFLNEKLGFNPSAVLWAWNNLRVEK